MAPANSGQRQAKTANRRLPGLGGQGRAGCARGMERSVQGPVL